jgi:DnaD/phage-associated family protein
MARLQRAVHGGDHIGRPLQAQCHALAGLQLLGFDEIRDLVCPSFQIVIGHRLAVEDHGSVAGAQSSRILKDLVQGLGREGNYAVVGLVDQLGFEEEAVLAILAYAVRLKKATVRYAEKIALSFYDEGLTAAEEVVARIHTIEEAAETVSQIRTLFGMGSRALSSTEKKLFAKWTETYGFDLAVIRMAYDITIDAIHAPVPKYAGTILEKWYQEGLRTARDIEEFERAKKSASGNGMLAKSYDVDDFFEASLKRSYESFDKDLNDVK